jgi:hypothetical protein
MVRNFVIGLLVGLLVTCPTFLVEEQSFGKPLIDHRSGWWVIPAAIMALGFFLGGLIAGFQARRVWTATAAGGLVAAVTVWLIFMVDLGRRHALGKPLNNGVERLWAVAAIGAILVGGLGGFVGYLRTASHRSVT